MFCKPGVKLILESLWAERENGGAEGHTGVTEKNSRIQEGGLWFSFTMQTAQPHADISVTACRTCAVCLKDRAVCSFGLTKLGPLSFKDRWKKSFKSQRRSLKS